MPTRTPRPVTIAALLAGALLTGALLALPLTAAHAAARDAGPATTVRFRLASREVGNLFHQLSCIAGLIYCSREVYRDLWQKELGFGPEDERALQVLRDLQRRAGSLRLSVPPARPSGSPATRRAAPAKLSFPLPGGDPDLWSRVRLAALQARDPEDLAERLALLLSAEDAGRLVALVERFRPRFAPWFRRARADLDRFARAFSRRASRPDLQRLVAGAARFYGVPGAATPEAPGAGAPITVDVALVARPRHRSGHTNAEQLEATSIIEVVAGERVEERLPVVLHELFHHFYALAPASRHAEVVRAFLGAIDPGALTAYHLLNEALATVLGNGLVERTLRPERFAHYRQRPQSFYSDDAIDRAAKAIFAATEACLGRGGKLDAAFVQVYLAEVRRALGSALLRPALSLRRNVFVFERELSDSKRVLARLIRVQHSDGFSPLADPGTRRQLDRYPDVSGGFLLLKPHLDRLDAYRHLVPDAARAELRRLARQHRGFVYALARTPRSRLYLFVAEDRASLEELFPRFAQVERPWLGLGPVLPPARPAEATHRARAQ